MIRKNTILLLASLLLILGIFAIRYCNKLQYKKYRANIEHNQDVMKYFVNDSTGFVRLAFAHLETQFANPNDFNLTAYSIRSRDTIINSIIDTVYSIYFTYLINNREKLSKFRAFNHFIKMDFFNIDLTDDKEYLSTKESSETQVKTTMKELKELKDSMPLEQH
jgi:hypothetical protein